MKIPKYWRAGVLGIVASLLAVIFIYSQMNDVGQMWSSLRSADYGWVLISMGIIVLGLFARGARWRALLNGHLPFIRAFNITNVSYLVNGVLPFRIGEVVRAFLATQAHPPVPVMKSIGTIIVERLIDVLSVLIILGFALSAVPLPDVLRSTAFLFSLGVVTGFVVIIFLAAKQELVLQAVDNLSSHIALLERWHLLLRLQNFLDGLTSLKNPRSIGLALILSAASWFCSLLSGYVLMIAFFGHGDWTATLLFSAAASLAVAVPAVPGNLGTYELSILLALRATGYGEPVAVATAFAIAVHAVNLLVNSSLGVLGFIREGVSLDQLSQGVREIKQPLG